MHLLFKRLLMYLLVPLALVWLAGPVSTRRPPPAPDTYDQAPTSIDRTATAAPEAQTLPGLRSRLRWGGLALMTLGLLAGGGLYIRHQRGLAVNKPGMMLFWDGLVLAVMFVVACGFSDFLLHQLLLTQPVKDAEYLHLLGVFGYLLLAPIMAASVTATSKQVLFIDHEGILSDSLAGKRSIAWNDIIEIKLIDLVNLKKIDFYSPRHMTKRLEIIGPFRRIRILEPPDRKRKERILAAMRLHSPAEWKPRIEELFHQW